MATVRLTSLGAALAAAALLAWPVASPGDLNHDLRARSATASNLRALIAAETKRIGATRSGVAAAQARLARLSGQVEAEQAQVTAVQRNVVAARNHLTQLENRLHLATTALAANLVGAYKDGAPDMITVVLESHGFADMLERLQFLERIQQHDSEVLSDTKTARTRVLRQSERLQRLLVHYRDVTQQLTEARNQAAAVQGALLARQAQQLQQRANTAAKLGRVQGQIATLKRQIARIAAQAPKPVNNAQLPIDPGGFAQAPPGAPAAVKQVIAAGNVIAGLPYLYGGGHGSFHANAYDCSGSVSYALAAAGLVSSPLDSTAFESWGQPGPGKWITVYANAGHAWMTVAGWRFDTVALASGGTRWSRTMASTSGFVARHPAGL